jgi:hypothetical protein
MYTATAIAISMSALMAWQGEIHWIVCALVSVAMPTVSLASSGVVAYLIWQEEASE